MYHLLKSVCNHPDVNYKVYQMHLHSYLSLLAIVNIVKITFDLKRNPKKVDE
jgi:hypothetical protein